MQFAPVDGVASLTSLDVLLRVEQGTGLVFYSSQYANRQSPGDFIALGLQNSTVVLYINLGRLYK